MFTLSMIQILGEVILLTISNLRITYLAPTNIVKNSDEENFVYSGYKNFFDSAASWNFDDDTARNAIIFGVDNNSSPNVENRKQNFLLLLEVLTFDINGSYCSAEKNFSISFSKTDTNFYLSLH